MPQKGTSTLRMRVCRQCGIEFMGGPRAWYCPTCRIERQREQERVDAIKDTLKNSGGKKF